MNRKYLGVFVAASAAGIMGCATEGPYSSPRMSSAGSGVYGTYYGPVPALDPNRKITMQDCTKPFAEDGGNLVCR